MGKLLTIETGFTCNSRCHYCTQLDYRVIPQADQLDLSTEQISQRIAYAASQGYDEIGFSGGEPTIRPDFLDLVALAKSYDFQKIGVTTNGRMFAYRAFAEQALDAGLNSFTFSIHGHTAEIHDRIAHARGAFDQAMQGLAHLSSLAKRRGIDLHLMNNQILLPDNTPYISDIIEQMAPHGVGLFMIQPFIAQRSNVDDLARFYVPYADVVQAVKSAIPHLKRWNARIKPYNVPNCLLWPLGREHVEAQFYDITVFREFEQEKAGEFKAFKAKQWYRIDDCRTCTEACPGFRIEQFPQGQMLDQVLETASEFAKDWPADPSPGPLLLTGTELFEPQTLRNTLKQLAAVHGPVGWLTAACERSTRQELAEMACDLAKEGVLAELVLVTQPLDQRFLAQRVLEKGNLEEMRQFLFRLAELREAGATLPAITVLLNIGDLLRLLEDPLLMPQWPALTKACKKAAGPAAVTALIAVSNFPRGQQPPDMQRQRQQNLDMIQRLADACRQAGLEPGTLTLGDRRGLDPARAEQMRIIEAQLAEVLPVTPWTHRLFRHPLARAELDFVTWSPPWLFEREGLASITSEKQTDSAQGLRQVAVAALKLGQGTHADGAGEVEARSEGG